MNQITAIVPAYNRAELVVESIHSLLAPGHPPLEILVVDDGSTDGTLAAALACGPAIRALRHETSQGQSAARNRGIQAVTTPYTYFLDSDDLAVPGGIQALWAHLKANPACGLAYGVMVKFGEGVETLPDDLNGVPAFNPGTFLVRTAEFRRVGLLDESLRIGEFLDWHGRATLAGIRMDAIHATVLQRRVHPGNISRHRAETSTSYHQILATHLKRRRAAAAQQQQQQ